MIMWTDSFETRPDGTIRDPADRGWNWVGFKKNKERQNSGWPSDPVKNPVATCWFLFFLLKRRRFDLKKTELTRSTWWPSQNPEPGPWTGSGLKIIQLKYVDFFLKKTMFWFF